MVRTEPRLYFNMLVLCNKLKKIFSIYFTVRVKMDYCCAYNSPTDIFKEFVKSSNNKHCGFVWADAFVLVSFVVMQTH